VALDGRLRGFGVFVVENAGSRDPGNELLERIADHSSRRAHRLSVSTAAMSLLLQISEMDSSSNLPT